jgi:type VI secretion system secreted protein VgrG
MPLQLSQQHRVFALSTPLGEDRLLIRSFSGVEAMSRPFHFTLDLVSTDGEISVSDLLGRPVSIGVQLHELDESRYFHGMVSRFALMPGSLELHEYRMEIVPWVWFLTRTADCRIFQNKSVPEILEQVFSDFGFSDYEIDGIRGTHERWEYCVQYRESAFQFVSRLMEQEGIHYYFRHERDRHVLALVDSTSAHESCPSQSTARFQHADGARRRVEDTVSSWQREADYRPGKWAQADYNFETPTTHLISTTESVLQVEGNQQYEVFDYPGEFATRSEGDRLTRMRMEEEEAAHDVARGESDCRAFSPGYKFDLQDHPRDDQNDTYLLVSVKHSASQGGFVGGENESDFRYANSFTCIPGDVTFRPARVTPKPVVHGSQTAVVTGPDGEEIYTDEYGRIKVQFHWDRYGHCDDASSCWIRVSQPWAGNNWGAIFLPRIGQEVVVSFLEGDPDRPLVTGCVYNARQMPPFELPSQKTRSAIKSRSSKQGSAQNFNELRLEDKKGHEQVLIRAEKNMDTFVKATSKESVGGDRHLTVNGKQYEKVESDKHSAVYGECRMGVNENFSVVVNQDWAARIYGSQIFAAERYCQWGSQEAQIRTNGQLSLVAPGCSITMGAGGIFIQGPMVYINSGAGPASPEPPFRCGTPAPPTGADNGED